jgi:hypothetical protein
VAHGQALLGFLCGIFWSIVRSTAAFWIMRLKYVTYKLDFGIHSPVSKISCFFGYGNIQYYYSIDEKIFEDPNKYQLTIDYFHHTNKIEVCMLAGYETPETKKDKTVEIAKFEQTLQPEQISLLNANDVDSNLA